MNKGARVLVSSIIVVILIIFVMNALGSSSGLGFGTRPKELNITALQKEIAAGNVTEASWQLDTITGKLRTGESFTTKAMPVSVDAATPLLKKFDDKGVSVEIASPPASQAFLQILGFALVPILFLVFFWLFVIRPAQSGGSQAMNFGRSKAKRAGEQGTKITFDDVAGIDEAKQELFEIVDFLRNTKKYVALGAKIPKGILLTGPPGVGKTHLARAIAGEAGVPFFHISGSDFVEMFVGVGAARVRDLFETAKAHRPCLIFVDEIDAVGRQRGAGMGGGHDEREQTLNQLLVEMDGFDANAGVIMIAATNRPDVLDPALLRPGRFDRQIVVDTPDVKGREAILNIHGKGKPFEPDVNMGTIAKRTPGFTGADLANALNESALLAARDNRTKIRMIDIEEALDRVMAGPQRRSRIMDEKEREVIAYHEAGHAVVGEILEFCDPVHKVTILPRGMSLGATWSLPEKDSYLISQQELLDDITALLGGRVAEDIVFGSVTTGASNDLQRVTAIARAMVTEFGMSDKLGTLAIGRRSRNPFLGRDFAEERDYSEDVARMIDEEVRGIVDTCRMRAHDLLDEHRPKLDAVVVALLERETIDRTDFLKIMAGETLPPYEAPVSGPIPDEEAESEAGVDKTSKSANPGSRLEPGTA